MSHLPVTSETRPDVNVATTNASSVVGKTAQRTDLGPVKRTAVEFLQQVCAKAEGVDKKSLFYFTLHASNDPTSMQASPIPGSIDFGSAKRSDHGYRMASTDIQYELEDLDELGLLPEDQKVLGDIYRHMRDKRGNAEDLQILGELLGKVTQVKYANEVDAYEQQLCAEIKDLASFCHNESASSPSDTYLAEHDVNGETKPRPVGAEETTLDDRKDLGKKLAKRYAPLRVVVAKTKGFDKEATLHEFDRLIRRLKRGEVQPRLMAELHEVVSRGLNPDQYARDTINDLYQTGMRLNFDGSRVLKRDDYSRSSLNSGFLDRNWDTREGAARVAQAIAGFRPIWPESSAEVFGEELALVSAIKKEKEVRFAHIKYLHGLMEREKNPAAFAISELVRINEMAHHVSDGKPITWRNSAMDFKMTWFSTEGGRRKAGEWLYARLEPLAELCDPTNAGQLKRVKELLQTIKDGLGTSSDIKELTNIFVNSANPPPRKPPGKHASDWTPKLSPSRDYMNDKVVASSQEKRTERACDEFDEWAKSEAPSTDPHVVQMLYTLGMSVRNFYPSQFGMFFRQISHIYDEKRADRQTIQTLQEILTEARRRETESRQAKHSASAGGDIIETANASSNKTAQLP